MHKSIALALLAADLPGISPTAVPVMLGTHTHAEGRTQTADGLFWDPSVSWSQHLHQCVTTRGSNQK